MHIPKLSRGNSVQTENEPFSGYFEWFRERVSLIVDQYLGVLIVQLEQLFGALILFGYSIPSSGVAWIEQGTGHFAQIAQKVTILFVRQVETSLVEFILDDTAK